MKARSLLILLVVTLAIAAAAAWALRDRSARFDPVETRAGELLFPGLRERGNAVATVRVVAADATLEVARAGEGEEATWGAVDKGGYPVDFERVRGLVVGLANLEIVAAKTSNPARFERLGLQDPTAPEAKSRRVTLLDRSGGVLADLVVGNQNLSGGVGRATQFVRKAGEDQTYEVAGRLDVEPRIESWLDKQIVKLERARVKSVAIAHPGGETLRVERESLDQQDFQVRDLPEGAELSWPGVAGSVASALEYLNLQDVQPAGAVDLSDVEPVEARFTTFDGLVVDARLYEKDGKSWLAVDAAFDAAERAEPATVEPPPADVEGDGEDEGEGELADLLTAGTQAAPGKSADEVRAEAERIDARTEPWVYEIPGYAASSIKKKVDDLLKKAPPPAEIPVEPPADTPEDAPPAEPTEPPADDPPADAPPAEEPPAEDDEPPPPADDGEQSPPPGDSPAPAEQPEEPEEPEEPAEPPAL